LIEVIPANSARFDHSYDPVSGTVRSLGLLVEEARTNGFVGSENITGLTGVAVAVAPSTEITPFNNTGAISLSDDNTNDQHYASLSVPITSGTPISVSIFAKLGSGTRNLTIRGLAASFGSVIDARFDLATGTATLTAASIQAFRNGWYRCTFTATPTTTGNAGMRLHLTSGTTIIYQGDGESSILLYGPQAENGSFPTSYIPTTSSTVTRTADNASMVGENFSSWYNQSEGTVYCSYKNNTTDSTTRKNVYAIQGTSSGIEIRSPNIDLNRLRFVYNGNFNSNATQFSATLNQRKTAFSYNQLEHNGCIDGILATHEEAHSNDNTKNILYIGYRVVGSFDYLCGTISQLTYYSKRLPNAFLQNLTK